MLQILAGNAVNLQFLLARIEGHGAGGTDNDRDIHSCVDGQEQSIDDVGICQMIALDPDSGVRGKEGDDAAQPRDHDCTLPEWPSGSN